MLNRVLVVCIIVLWGIGEMPVAVHHLVYQMAQQFFDG